MRKYMYVIERIKDSRDWPKGIRITADRPCKGWRVVEKIKVR